MEVTRADLAEAYGVSRARIYQLHDAGISFEEMEIPSLVFEKLLNGHASRLRERLSDPTERERISNRLRKLESEYLKKRNIQNL